jgi:hypothetical protein
MSSRAGSDLANRGPRTKGPLAMLSRQDGSVNWRLRCCDRPDHIVLGVGFGRRGDFGQSDLPKRVTTDRMRPTASRQPAGQPQVLPNLSSNRELGQGGAGVGVAPIVSTSEPIRLKTPVQAASAGAAASL